MNSFVSLVSCNNWICRAIFVHFISIGIMFGTKFRRSLNFSSCVLNELIFIISLKMCICFWKSGCALTNFGSISKLCIKWQLDLDVSLNIQNREIVSWFPFLSNKRYFMSQKSSLVVEVFAQNLSEMLLSHLKWCH